MVLSRCLGLLCAVRAVGSEASDETCSATGTCGEGLPTLTVRYEPYMAEEQRNSIYGGAHLEAGLLKHGFTERVFGDDWHLLWTHNSQGKDFDAQVRSLPPRKDGKTALANNCGFYKAAGQKCYFAGHIRRILAALEEQDPAKAKRFTHLRNLVINHKDQFAQWQREVRADPSTPWVYKICNAGMSQGVEILRGKELLERIASPRPSDIWTVVQEYLQNIFMGFGQRKFHLRVYAFVTQWHPSPHVFIYNEGVVFRSRHKYNPKQLSNKRDIFSAISDDVEAFPHTHWWSHLDELHAQNASSPTAASVKEHMLEVINALFSVSIDASMGKAETFAKMLKGRGYNCFDLFGLDVMFNERLEPIILEVNTGPNMEIDDRGEEASGLLKGVKGPLIDQLGHWMRLRVQDETSLEEQETAALVGFTRVV